jgi:hypothetical protein
MRLVALSIVLLGPSCVADSNAVIDGRRSPILGGEDAAGRTDVVYVEHAAGSERCTGALVAPQIVITAAHCAFPIDGLSTTPLSADGFRIGFGAATDTVAFKQAVAVSMPLSSSGLTLNERVDAGLDIVALTLATPDGDGSDKYEPDFAFEPNTSTSLELVGYGISSKETGEIGEKLSGWSAVIGWDRESGVLELEGEAAACLGDSGGPALTTDGRWVGVISSVSSTDNGIPCDGRTFLTTMLNDEVRAWLHTLLQSSTDVDAGTDEASDTHSPPSPGHEPDDDAEPPETDQDPLLHESCAVSWRGRNESVPWWLCIGGLGLLLRTRRRRQPVVVRARVRSVQPRRTASADS